MSGPVKLSPAQKKVIYHCGLRRARASGERSITEAARKACRFSL